MSLRETGRVRPKQRLRVDLVGWRFEDEVVGGKHIVDEDASPHLRRDDAVPGKRTRREAGHDGDGEASDRKEEVDGVKAVAEQRVCDCLAF